MSELSRRLIVSNGAITGLVDKLVEAGLVTRREDPKDRRSMIVRLTRKGRDNFLRMARRGLAWGEVLDMNSREAVRETVAAGLGVGVVSAGEFSKDPRLAILELTGADMAMTEYIVCLAERQNLRLVRSFLDLVNQPLQNQIP